MSEVKLNHLTTERRNEKTMNLDTLSTHELLQIMNEEDHKVPEAVREAIPEIEKAVQAIIKALRSGGRLIYMGAGTSGRLGVIDSAECMPTFGTTYEVVGLLAGGPDAFLTAVEGAEDDAELGKQDLVDQKLTEKDVVCGIAASGRTPYVIGGLDYARSIGATAVSVACNKNSEVGKHADVAIEVDAGPEVLPLTTTQIVLITVHITSEINQIIQQWIKEPN